VCVISSSFQQLPVIGFIAFLKNLSKLIELLTLIFYCTSLLHYYYHRFCYYCSYDTDIIIHRTNWFRGQEALDLRSVGARFESLPDISYPE
jgi:hypothetical protein